jgi:tRNA A-37 threonylcarbamoyl transferase component Bud32
MASVLTPYSQWIQTLKYDIMSMFQSYKNVFIHRAKLACLCQELSVFHRAISSKQYPTAPAQPNEANYLRQLVNLIAGLRQLFHSLDQQHAMQTLVQAPVGYVKQFLGEFRQNFNSHVAALTLVPQAPCPANAAQEKTDDFADARELNDRLTAYLQQTQIPPDFQQILCQRLQELREIIQGYEEEQEKAIQQTAARNRPMTPQEVEKALVKMKRWALDHADFELQKKIGSGGFADVFLGYQRSTRKIVAVKKLHNEEFTEQAFEMFRREIEIFAALNHFAVLPFVGVCCSPPYYIITEYMSGGCLFNRLHARDGSRLDPTKRTIIALGTAYAMEHVHAQKMVHRDLKPLNILLDADDYPKVCDFGMSREIATDGNMTGGVGTSQWMAPEVLNSDPYDERSDVYSFG